MQCHGPGDIQARKEAAVRRIINMLMTFSG